MTGRLKPQLSPMDPIFRGKTRYGAKNAVVGETPDSPPLPIVGSGSSLQESQTGAGAGLGPPMAPVGSGSSTQESQTASATGTATDMAIGSGSPSQVGQVASGAGIVTATAIGSGSPTQANQTGSGIGTPPPPVTGSAARVQASQTAFGVGSMSGAVVAAGSDTIGTTSYTIPGSNVIYVSPSGNDSNPGTFVSPKLTIGGAQSAATSGTVTAEGVVQIPGTTIVIRAGTYNETVTTSKNGLTFQSYPNEAVWMDGSIVVSSWAATGPRWQTTGWTFEPPTGASFSPGVHDASWIDPAFPMASHPDQVFIDNVKQTQVSTEAAVVAGQFYHDRAGDRIVIGTNPSGKTIRIGNKINALVVSGLACTFRGIGVRRYSNNVSALGALTFARWRCNIENVVVEDCANVGMSVGHSNTLGKSIVVNKVTIQRCGLLGFLGNKCDGLVLTNTLIQECNSERYKPAPTAAGLKITHARGLLFKNLKCINNWSFGFWLDESVYDWGLYSTTCTGNVKGDCEIELSGNGVIAGCHFDSSLVGEMSLQMYDSGNIKVFCCYIGGGRLHDFQIKLDGRGELGPTTGYTSSGQRDQRYANWATYATAWRWNGIEYFNCVMGVTGTPAQNPRSLWMEDVGSLQLSADDAIDVSFHHNYLPNRNAASGTALMVYENPNRQTWHTVAQLLAHDAAWNGNVQASDAFSAAVMLAAAQDSWATGVPSAASIMADFASTGQISTTTGDTANVNTSSLFDVTTHLGLAVGAQVMGPP